MTQSTASDNEVLAALQCMRVGERLRRAEEAKQLGNALLRGGEEKKAVTTYIVGIELLDVVIHAAPDIWRVSAKVDVPVRAGRSVEAEQLGTKPVGSLFRIALRSGDWACLQSSEGFGEEAWLLINRSGKIRGAGVMIEQELAEEQRERTQTLYFALRLNAALACLTGADWLQASEHSSAVLHVDDANPKALYRRAVAFLNLGSKAKLEQAQEDLCQVLEQEPQNDQALKQLKQVEEKLEALKSKQDKKQHDYQLYEEDYLRRADQGQPFITFAEWQQEQTSQVRHANTEKQVVDEPDEEAQEAHKSEPVMSLLRGDTTDFHHGQGGTLHWHDVPEEVGPAPRHWWEEPSFGSSSSHAQASSAHQALTQLAARWGRTPLISARDSDHAGIQDAVNPNEAYMLVEAVEPTPPDTAPRSHVRGLMPGRGPRPGLRSPALIRAPAGQFRSYRQSAPTPSAEAEQLATGRDDTSSTTAGVESYNASESSTPRRSIPGAGTQSGERENEGSEIQTVLKLHREIKQLRVQHRQAAAQNETRTAKELRMRIAGLEAQAIEAESAAMAQVEHQLEKMRGQLVKMQAAMLRAARVGDQMRAGELEERCRTLETRMSRLGSIGKSIGGRKGGRGTTKQREAIDHKERRQDPEDGCFYTFDEYRAKHMSNYSDDDITAYWLDSLTRDPFERRTCPDDGKQYTFDEILEKFPDVGEEDLRIYWRDSCD